MSIPEFIFHGNCHGCLQQGEHGTDFCFDCCYFDGDWVKPDLSRKPKTRESIEREKVKMRRAQGGTL